MTRADYTYQIIEKDKRVIAIEDLNLGNTSVTNDLENIVLEIAKVEDINVNHYYIVYKDSCGVWDGWDHYRKAFIYLTEDSLESAISKYAQISAMR